MNSDNAVGFVLADKLKNKAAFRLRKRGVAETVAVDAIGCREVTVQVDAASVVATVVGYAVRIGNG